VTAQLGAARQVRGQQQQQQQQWQHPTIWQQQHQQ
jgi:hypothetical protein